MYFRQITDPKLAQYAYLIGCQRTGEALIIDPERDIDRYEEIARQEGFRITAAADTHIHADYLSGVREYAERGVRIYVSDEGGADWSYEWVKEADYDAVFLRDGDTFKVGNIQIQAVHTPGHTPEHLSYLVTDLGGGATQPIGIVTGDFVFVGDLGRPDLLETAARISGAQEPSARRLYGSVQRFLEMPDYLQVWPGHGAGSACGKALGAVPQSTVGYERQFNASVDAARRGEDAFVEAILSGQPEPPLYFARMKTLNRDGAPILGGLPRPHALDVEALRRHQQKEDVLFVDTRLDTDAFMSRHLPRSLYAPLNKTFNTIVGSYVTDDATPLSLIIEQDRVEEAVRDLVRVGYDRIESYVTPAVLEAYFAEGGESGSIRSIDIDTLEAEREDDHTVVVDVRSASEYASVHIPGALNIAHTRLADRLDEVPRDKTALVHCASGSRSAVAAALLAREGIDVHYVPGRFDEWVERFGKTEAFTTA